jgi:FdhE protein
MALAGLKRARPEWGPWLAVIEETLRDADAPVWDEAVPAEVPVVQATAPLLSRATLVMEQVPVRRLLQRLIRVASRSGTPEMASLKSAIDRDVEVLEIFRGSLCQDNLPAMQLAESSGASAAALQAVVALLAVPFLHSCNRKWAKVVPAGWVEGYCPICGAWPSFAEARGIERNRYFRCGRCGGEWHARPLRCPYCRTDDHNALVSLVPDNTGLNAVIEGCRSCFGYVKTFTRLQGCPPSSVMLDDLASVHLDVAVLEQGYARPQGIAHPLGLTVTSRDPARRFFTWKA